MKQNIFKISLLFLVASTTVSCDNLLDQRDPNLISESVVLNNLTALNKVNLGFYLSIPATTNWYAQSLITDELVINAQNLGGGAQYYGWDYGPGTIADRDDNMGLFRGYYNVISKANLTLSGIDDAPANGASEINLKNTLKAEALGMRAFGHYMLLQLFSPKYSPAALGVAYKTSKDERELPVRENMQQSYAKVLGDLTAALSLFPATLPSGYGGAYQNNRITKTAVEALIAKVNLETGNYNDAVTYANIVLGKTSLTTAANIINLWSDRNDYQEVIFKQSNIAGAGGSPGVLFYNTVGQVQYNASATVLNKYSASDARAALFFDLGAKGTIPAKYLLPWDEGVKPNQGLADIKLIRTAEIVLLKAEALARKATPDLIGSFNEYKKVRDSRNAGVSVAFVSPQDALDKILLERDRELAYEGYRLTDIKRFGKTIQRNAADIRPNFPNLNLTDVNKYTLPIPQAERFANPDIQQNLGW